MRSYIISLWQDGQFWSTAFLNGDTGRIRLYPCEPRDEDEFTPDTLPPGTKVCPSLTMGHDFAPKKAQDEAKAAALAFGYEIFEIDIVPW